MKIISTYNNIPKKDLYDCRITSLREVFRHYKIDNIGYELFFFSKCINFLWSELIYQGLNFPIVGVSNIFVEEEVAKCFNIEIEKINVKSSEQLFDVVKRNIDNNIPLIFLYNPEKFELKNKNGKKKGILDFSFESSGVFAGYDEITKELYYASNTESKEFGLNKNSIEEIYYAMQDDNLINASCMIYKFYINDKKSKEINESIKEKLFKSLIEISDYMLNEKINEYCGQKVIACGVEGIKSFYQYLEELSLQVKNIEEIYPLDKVKKIVYIKMYVLRRSMLKGSNTCFRGEFSDCLEVIKNKYFIEELKELIEEFKYLATLYRGVVRKLNMLLTKEEKFGDEIIKIANQYKKIYELEKKSFSKLKNTIEVLMNER